MAATNYYKNIKEKLLELIDAEFKGELVVYKEDMVERFGLAHDSVALDAGERILRERLGGAWFYDYPVDIIVRRRVVNPEEADEELSYIVERIEERLVERDANRNQQANGLWFDSRIDVVDPPELVDLAAEEDAEELLAHQVVIHWTGTIARCPTTS